jgi:hypothetical protein
MIIVPLCEWCVRYLFPDRQLQNGSDADQVAIRTTVAVFID